MCVGSPTGIFAFKCARAEEIFNMLQDIMHNNSISVVEEPVFEPALTHTHTELDAPQTPRTPTGNTHTIQYNTVQYSVTRFSAYI